MDERDESTAIGGVCPVLARRALLLAAGGAGLAALLAACGADPAEPAAAGTPSGNPSDGPTDNPGEVDPSEEDTTGWPPEGALVAVDEVPAGGGVIVTGDVLVVRLKRGTFRAFDARCPHQATVVYEPDSSGVILCPGHNSHFRADDGSRIDGPAPRGLRSVRVKVSDGYVVLA